MKTKTPELNKIIEAAEDMQKICEFLEWLDEREIILAKWTGSKYCEECGEEPLMCTSQSREQLLANYCGIDLVKAEKERQALLDEIRAANETTKLRYHPSMDGDIKMKF